MTMDESVRLARMEAKLDHLREYLEAKDKSQEKHNDLFYKTRDKVNEMEAKQKGAWVVITVMASVLSAVSTFVISLFKG